MDPNIVFILEVIGTVTFAFSGAYVAINQDLDWLGIMLMACCTACGGGMTRDVIIDNTPANLFKNPTYVAMAAVVAFITIESGSDNSTSEFVNGVIISLSLYVERAIEYSHSGFSAVNLPSNKTALLAFQKSR